MAFVLDPALERFSTPRQWELLTAWKEHGSQRKAAEALGVANNLICQAWAVVKDKADKCGYSPDGGACHEVADGYFIKGKSTLYDADGELVLEWVKTGIDQERQQAAMEAAIEGLAGSVKRTKPRKPALKEYSKDLLTGYPIGDHHLGMLSWAPETGADYDLKIGEELITGAMDHLVDRAMPSDQALIAFLGDYMHFDGYAALTPTSGNLLDTDTRFPKIVEAAIRSMRYLIERALDKHRTVHVIVEEGNHDPASTVFLRACLANVYENEGRVTIDTSPGLYHYYRFGKALIGTHHGHKVRITKADDLSLIMANDRPKDWADSEHRFMWTGHIHHDRQGSGRGSKVESFSILPPPDAHHSGAGYRSTRGMKSVTFHREHGEYCRHSVNPGMLV